MAKGLPKSIIAKYGITKKAWQVFRGKRSSRASKPHSIKSKIGGIRRRMARKHHSRRSSMTIPIAPVVGLMAGLIDPIDHLMKGDYVEAINHLSENYTGWNTASQSWNIFAAKGLPPLIAGLLVHKFIGGPPLNLNRTLARAKVPLIRI